MQCHARPAGSSALQSLYNALLKRELAELFHSGDEAHGALCTKEFPQGWVLGRRKSCILRQIAQEP